MFLYRLYLKQPENTFMLLRKVKQYYCWLPMEWLNNVHLTIRYLIKSLQDDSFFYISPKMFEKFRFSFKSNLAQRTNCIWIFSNMVNSISRLHIFDLWSEFVLGLYELPFHDFGCSSVCNRIHNVCHREIENFRIYGFFRGIASGQWVNVFCIGCT